METKERFGADRDEGSDNGDGRRGMNCTTSARLDDRM